MPPVHCAHTRRVPGSKPIERLIISALEGMTTRRDCEFDYGRTPIARIVRKLIVTAHPLNAPCGVRS